MAHREKQSAQRLAPQGWETSVRRSRERLFPFQASEGCNQNITSGTSRRKGAHATLNSRRGCCRVPSTNAKLPSMLPSGSRWCVQL